MNNIEKIIIGTLLEKHYGYSKGTKICGIFRPETDYCFLIAIEENDENFGYILTVGKSLPKIEIETTIETIETRIKFQTYFNLIVEKINIPKTFELFENLK